MQAFAVTKRYLSSRAAPSSTEAVATKMRSIIPTRLTPAQKKHARIAWAYFDRFTDPGRGFCPATRPPNTHAAHLPTKGALGPWEMGATLQAILCAGLLKIIPPPDMRARIEVCLHALADLPLNALTLPAVSYCNATLAPLDGHGTKVPLPVTGYSPRQIMRLVVGFITVAHHCPDLAPEISLILNRWRLDRLLNQGSFVPPQATQNTAHPPADTYLGYEQYAARVACLVGLNARPALELKPVLGWHTYRAQALPCDRRQSARTPHVITSDPFHLEAMEFGWRQPMAEIAASLLLAQKSRFEQTGHLTALTEEVLDRPPGIAIQGLLARASPYVSLDQNGANLDQFRCLSTKAAFGWWALIPSPYAQKLLDAVSDLQTRNGWLAGLYEATGRPNAVLSLNTNATILEALHYRAHGPLFAASTSGL